MLLLCATLWTSTGCGGYHGEWGSPTPLSSGESVADGLRKIRNEFYAMKRPLVQDWRWIPPKKSYHENPFGPSGWEEEGARWLPVVRQDVWSLLHAHSANELIAALLPLGDTQKWAADVSIVLDHGEDNLLHSSPSDPSPHLSGGSDALTRGYRPPKPTEYQGTEMLIYAQYYSTFQNPSGSISGLTPPTIPTDALGVETKLNTLQGQLRSIALQIQYTPRLGDKDSDALTSLFSCYYL